MTRQRNTRRFNYDGSIAYQGSLYPSTQMDIEDDKGNVSSRNVFADASGQYYTLNEDGNAIPIILQNNLDEVTVTAPRNRRNTFNDYLTMSNDATKVFNTPHREYNPHLREAAIRGAESHALWEKEHPNATAWGNALASVPFAVAATPLAMAAGDAMAGSALGQYLGNGLNMIANAASNSSWFPWADTLASSYFATHGLQDMANGKFTPETAMEVMPLMQMAKPMYRAGKDAYNVGKELYNANKFKSELDWSPESWFATRTGNIGYDAEDVAALRSHILEYHQIEKQAKADGTWLKMPDGSTWEGDPRSWVQMMSSSYDRYTRNSPFKYEPFAHSTDDIFDTFDMSYFGKTDQGFYGKGFYTHPAENISGELRGRNSYGDNNYLLTTNVKKPLDLHSTDFEYAGLFNWENTNAPKGIFDNYDSVYYGVPGNKMVGASPSELVVPSSNNYKSLLGNNGNFNPLNPNIYKVMMPFGVSTIAINQLQDK